ncbi:hypothetical protein MMC18_008552 [Xylographa bjoerkii]|nr:hypothetical protein [Xylographa bjoerkii]
MCQMIEYEVLQSIAFRQQEGAPVQTLQEDVVAGRGALPITPTVEEMHLDSEKYTRIHLWLKPSHHDQPSSIQILCPRLLVIDTESSVRFEGRLHSYTDWHEARKRYPKYDDIPELEVWTSEGDAMVERGILPRKHVPHFSLESLDSSLMKSWIEECCRNHPECAGNLRQMPTMSNISPPLPKRVLQITGDPANPHIRLYETNGAQGEYVALSYCWGRSATSNFLTTTSTISARKAGISIHDLPKTYIDAIHITQSLGAQYLWIDALCIIQFSSDWVSEASKMGQYYGNALVTISVTCSPSTTVGFLHSKPSPFDPLHLSYLHPPHSPSHLALCRSIYSYRPSVPTHRSLASLWGPNVEQCPLGTRAWALQERLLSPRKLHFGTDHLFWECRRSRLAQGGDAYLYAVGKPAITLHTALTTADWYEFVSHYSTRRLTNPGDRLIAISGLAKLFHAAVRQEYIAGLWAQELHDGLAWKVPSKGAAWRPVENRVPSWSWASLEGAVEMLETRSEAAFSVVTARTDVVDLDPFGAVAGGELVLRGQLNRVRVRADAPETMFAVPASGDGDWGTGFNVGPLNTDVSFKYEREGHVDLQRFYRHGVEIACPFNYETDRARIFGGSNVVGDYWDDLQKTREGEVLWALRLTAVMAVQGPSLPLFQHVMVLEEVESPEAVDVGMKTYQRVGAGQTWDEDFFASCPMEVLRII